MTHNHRSQFLWVQLQAIAVLQRDLIREEQRIKLAEGASAASRTGKTSSSSPNSTRIQSPSTTDVIVKDETQLSQNVVLPTPTHSPPGPSSMGPGRRPSAISISSLHRPAFPLKLDLSSAALRISAEEASMFTNGLASPVTLAPKSARAVGPNEYPPDLMAFVSSNPALERSVDIDLTAPDTNNSNDVKLLNVGNTVEKPIELDLDAMDIDLAMNNLFGDAANSSTSTTDTPMDDLFPAMVTESIINPNNVVPTSDKTQAPFLDALNQSSNNDDDIFASLGVEGDTNLSQQLKDQSSESQPAPSPTTLLASFESTSQIQEIDTLASSTDVNISEPPFGMGLDFSNLSPSFFEHTTDSEMKFSMEMDNFYNIGSTNDGKDNGEEKKPESA